MTKKNRVLIINTVNGFASTGKICSELTKSNNYEVLLCYGRKKDFLGTKSYKFANFFDNAFGAIGTIIFGNSISICSTATKRLIKKIEEFNPDIIHLHNIHGYYLNVEMLFAFLKQYNKPVVWTFHDCWPFTGYCCDAYYVNCEKYKKECKNCDHWFAYPFSIFKQRVNLEYKKKKELFTTLDKLTIVSPSKWLGNIISYSFLKNKRLEIINNGINLDSYKPTKKKNNKFTVLAVSSFWTLDKGLEDLNKMIPLLDKDIEVIVVGSGSDKVNGAICIPRTNSKQELIDIYSSSHVLINPTLDDNLPTVNIESIACGTPVITYNTGGSPEIIDEKTGIVVPKGDFEVMAKEINRVKNNYYFNQSDCLNRAKLFSTSRMLEQYESLYNKLLK